MASSLYTDFLKRYFVISLLTCLDQVAPLLATSFLASPSDSSLMKRTPEKNDPKVNESINAIFQICLVGC